MDPELQKIIDSIPASVKKAVSEHNTTKLAEAATGITDYTLENIAQHFGTKMASRKQRWRPIAEGLMALHQLRG